MALAVAVHRERHRSSALLDLDHEGAPGSESEGEERAGIFQMRLLGVTDTDLARGARYFYAGASSSARVRGFTPVAHMSLTLSISCTDSLARRLSD